MAVVVSMSIVQASVISPMVSSLHVPSVSRSCPSRVNSAPANARAEVGGSSSSGAADVVTVTGFGLRAEPAGVAGPDGVGVGRLGLNGVVGVAGSRAFCVVGQYGQRVGVVAAQDLVAGDGVIVWVVP